jgi:hypothetical protein
MDPTFSLPGRGSRKWARCCKWQYCSSVHLAGVMTGRTSSLRGRKIGCFPWYVLSVLWHRPDLTHLVVDVEEPCDWRAALRSASMRRTRAAHRPAPRGCIAPRHTLHQWCTYKGPQGSAWSHARNGAESPPRSACRPQATTTVFHIFSSFHPFITLLCPFLHDH